MILLVYEDVIISRLKRTMLRARAPQKKRESKSSDYALHTVNGMLVSNG
jgi:hypothetical protein